jgi:hypothetical protein
MTTPTATATADQTLAMQGVHLLLTNQFNKAQQFYDSNFDKDPKVALLHTLLAYGKAISSYSETDLQAAIASCKRTDTIGEKLEKAAKKDELNKKIEGMLIQADSQLIMTLIQLVQENPARMMWHMRKSYNQYHDVQKVLPKYNGPQKEEFAGWTKFGVGLFNLAISLLPPRIVAIAEVIGFTGDKEGGLKMLTECVHSPVFMAPFAALLLLTFYVTISAITGDDDPNMLVEAEKLLQWADAKYPNGAFFALMRSRLDRCKCDPRKAIEASDAAVNLVDELPSVKILFYYQKAWCSWFIYDWQVCAENFDKLLHSKLNGDYVPPNSSSPKAATNGANASAVEPTQASAQALYAYQVGLCYAMMGDFHRSDWYLQSVPKWLLKSPKEIELWGKRKSEELLSRKRRIKEDYLLDVMELNHAWNGYNQMPHDKLVEAEQLLLEAEASEKKGVFKWEEEDKLRCTVQLAAVRSALKKYTEALTPLKAAVETNKSFLKSSRGKKSGLAPFLYFELANLSYLTGDLTNAKEYQKKSDKLDNYDQEKMLQVRLHGLKRRIKEAEGKK